jgi:sulfatase modifying factor 1
LSYSTSLHRQVLNVFVGIAALVMPILSRGAEGAVTIDWVTVGDPGNAADITGYGAVSEEFRIGKYEVTIAQYAAFLNAVAKRDPYFLWNGLMADPLIAGISRSGSSGSFTYSVIGPSGTTPAGANSPGDRPITMVSWFSAARFANWMHNGQGSGDTETGAYMLNGVTDGMAPARNPGAEFYIPTENQWYKAAYYKGGGTDAGYWTFATQTDIIPSNFIGSAVNQANYREIGGFGLTYYSVTQSIDRVSNQNYLTNVGAFSGSPSAYGTFDQAGNVSEWNDLDGVASFRRGLRGGDWFSRYEELQSSVRREPIASDTGGDNNIFGFRLASPVPVPEPSTWMMGLAGIACAGWGAIRRRRAL